MTFPREPALDIMQRAMTSPNGLKVSTSNALALRNTFREIVKSLGINPFQDLMLILAPDNNSELFLVTRQRFANVKP